MIDAIVGLVGSGLLLTGLTLASIGLYGMLRKPSIFDQLHAAGLVTGAGVVLVLLASLASGSAETATSALLVVAFVLVTSSLSTHAIALAAWRLGSTSAIEPAGLRPGAMGSGATDARTTAGMRVLLAHDDSPGANLATALVASLPWPSGSVIRLIGATEGELQPVPPTQEAELPDHPAPVALPVALDTAASTLRRAGLTVDAVIRPGEPAAAIAGEAGDFGAQLVVTGTRDLGRMETLFAGSVAARVVDIAPCPVLIARGPRIDRAILPTDGTAPSDEAVEVLARWPIFAGVSIEVLSVATDVREHGDPRAGSGMREAVETSRQQRVADAAAIRLVEAGRRATTHVRVGEAAAQIVDFAAARSGDLVVIGTRGRTGLRRTLLGSVSREVLSSARTSVLIVRAARDTTERRGGPPYGGEPD